MVYKRYYPGYQDPSKHPDNLCIPCCFTTPSSKQYGEYEYDIDRDVFIDKNGVITVPQKIEEKNSWKPNPLPTFERDPETKKIVLEDDKIKGKKQEKPFPRKDNVMLKENCDQKEEMLSIESKESRKIDKRTKYNKISQLIEDKPLYEMFPLKKNQTGYLTQVLQKFLNYDTTSCFKNRDKYLKENSYCLLRMGVERDLKKSFELYCFHI